MAGDLVPPDKASSAMELAKDQQYCLLASRPLPNVVTATDISQAKQNVNRALAITEVAERIFLELPPREILVAIQRTCRHFKAVVDGSKLLQQALLFEPILEPHVKSVNTFCFLAHPLLEKMVENDTAVKARCHHASASWRRQLAFQPPLKYLAVMDEKCPTYDSEASNSWTTVGQVAKVFSKQCREWTLGGLKYPKFDAFRDMPAKQLLEELKRGAETSRSTEQFAWCGEEEHDHRDPKVVAKEQED